MQRLDEDEYVRVEKVEDTYFIKTGPCPFRPDRGVYRSDRSKGPREVERRTVAKKDEERRENAKTVHLAKFTYFLNPSSRSDLMNYRMSRKDKKYSETYHERMKRRQRELEESIRTITTISQHRKLDTSVADPSFNANDKSAEESIKQISRFVSTKDSILLQKIREKSRRKKRLAPKPSAKRRISGTFNGDSAEREKPKKLPLKRSRENKSDDCKITYVKNDENDKDKGEKQSTLKYSQSASTQDCHDSKNNVGNIKISKIASSEQESNRDGSKGIRPKSYHMENKDKGDEIVREQFSKFIQLTNEELKKSDEHNSDLTKFDASKSRERCSFVR